MLNPSVFTGVINGYLPEPHASLLNGIIFGINLKTTKGFYDELKMVGLLHLVVLSGTNITFLAGTVNALLVNISKRLRILITILIIILFILFVGPQAPIIRAGVMGLLTLVAFVIGRKNSVYFSILLSVLFIAVFYPRWLTSVSTMLSYGATVGIIIFGQSSSRNVIIRDLRISLAAQIFTAPVIFIFFRQFSLISPLANILVAWLIPPLMVFGFLTAILGKINFYLGYPTSVVCYGLLSYMVFIIDFLSRLPFIFFQF